MSQRRVNETSLTATADALRAKLGTSDPITWEVDQGFKEAVESIPTDAGGGSSGPFAAVSVKEGADYTVVPVVNVTASAEAFDEDIIATYQAVEVEGATNAFQSISSCYGYIGNLGTVFPSNPGPSVGAYSRNAYSDYSMCKIEFNFDAPKTITLLCSYDPNSAGVTSIANGRYCLISQVNTELSMAKSQDGATGSEKVLKCFMGNGDICTNLPIMVDIPAGESFITLKSVKTDSASGTLYFWVSVEI